MVTALGRAAGRLPTASGSSAPRTWPARWASCRRWTSRSIRAGATRCGPACSAACSCSLSYFGTDQSQVQRYIGGAALREGRLGLMFNAVLKIPMQFFILLLGALVFVFYQFAAAPGVLQPGRVAAHAASAQRRPRSAPSRQSTPRAVAPEQEKIRAWLEAARHGDAAREAGARAAMVAAQNATEAVRAEAKAALVGRRSARQDQGLRLRVHHASS